jgi:hypothetical protein
MSTLAVLIAASPAEPGCWQVSLACAGSLQAFVVQPPPLLRELESSWWQRFVRHHDPTQPWHRPDVVQERSLRFQRELQQWLLTPAWLPLQQLLAQWPEAPVSLAFSGLAEADELLPWEGVFSGRRVWRVATVSAALPPAPPPPARKPRVLLVIGAADGLDLAPDLAELQHQAASGRIELTVLQAAQATAVALQQQLAEAKGWDALVFLGHSQASGSGGVLQMGDGAMLSGIALEQALREAAARGLQLVLLNSCSGLDLAKSAARAGVAWSLCFLRPIPSAAATTIFALLLQRLEEGTELADAIASLRQQLATTAGVEGCDLLLALVGLPAAAAFQLPLRKRQQFLRRLQSTTRRQWLTAAGLSAAAVWMQALVPWNPINQELLDRRLQLQVLWRQLTGQKTVIASGRRATPLPVLLLDERRIGPELGARPTPGRVSRFALAAVLQRTDPQRVPLVGLDVVLDEQQPGTAELAAVLRAQQRRVVAGWIANNPTADTRLLPGDASKPLPELQQAGLESRAIGMALANGSEPRRNKWRPLQLSKGLSPENLAVALSRHPQGSIPSDAVLDWSLQWDAWLRWLQPGDLPALTAPVLLVASDGQVSGQEDLFAIPSARLLTLSPQALAAKAAIGAAIPGAHVQAVLIQSLNLNHWLTPWPCLGGAPLTPVAAAGGILLAAAVSRRRQRVLSTAGLAAVALPLSLQLAVSSAILIPLLLPGVALGLCAFGRDD